MATYSFDDDSRTSGSFSLAGIGTLAPGESGLIVEKTAAAFRTDWGLPDSVKIADLNTNNLGRADEINLFDGSTLADRLTYDDQTKFPGSIRTVGKSGVPSTCLALGANNVGAWVFSVVGDANGTKTSVSGDIGSPGTTTLGSVWAGHDRRRQRHAATSSSLPCQPESPSGTGPAPAGAQTWPGGATVAVADQSCAWKTATGPEGRDMSGLVFDPTDPSVLWAVKNKSWVFRLVRQGDTWVPDTVNDWGAGKRIFFPGGVGQPDSEGLTVGADGALYITTERDNSNNTFSLNSVLRFDPTAAGTTLTPTQQWNLTTDFPELVPHDPVTGERVPNKDLANLGFEGVAYVPDTYLVQNGFVDQSINSAYSPSDYPNHGDGLLLRGTRERRQAVRLCPERDGTAHRVAVVDTGMGHVMDVQYDAGLQRIWTLCDNTCSVSSTLLKVDTTGAMVPDVVYARPAGDAGVGALPNVNIEGFAIAADTTCVDGFKEVVWSDDGIAAVGHEGHALYRGTFPCGLDLGEQGAPAAVDLGARGVGDVTAAKKSTLHVHGSGFEPGETVRVELHVKKKIDLLASVVVDAFGLAIADVVIPTGVQPGAQEVWLVAPSATVTADVSIATPGHG